MTLKRLNFFFSAANVKYNIDDDDEESEFDDDEAEPQSVAVEE